MLHLSVLNSGYTKRPSGNDECKAQNRCLGGLCDFMATQGSCAEHHCSDTLIFQSIFEGPQRHTELENPVQGAAFMVSVFSLKKTND